MKPRTIRKALISVGLVCIAAMAASLIGGLEAAIDEGMKR